MKPMMILGIVLIVVGAIGLTSQGISYTTREKVVDIGSLEITAENHKTIPLPLVGSGLAVAAGVVLVAVASKNK